MSEDKYKKIKEKYKDVRKDLSVDWVFISGQEGWQLLDGYVLDPKAYPNSGVTIATGFDLGCRNEEDLDNLRLSEKLKSKFKDYLGKKGPDAHRIFNENKSSGNKLSVSEPEANEIDCAVANDILNKLEKNYDSASGIKFKDLLPSAQTVIASVAFQYGENIDEKAPRFWKHVTNQDWNEAIEELKNFTTKKDKKGKMLDKKRRDAEADLLEKGTKKTKKCGAKCKYFEEYGYCDRLVYNPPCWQHRA